MIKLSTADPATVKLNEQFEIVEPSNKTTGYSWTIDGFKALEDDKFELIKNDSPFVIHEHEYIAPSQTGHGGARLMGAGGHDRFIVSAKVPGKHELKLLLKRPWQAEHAKELTYNLTVEG